jgi:hypothetical protein
MARMQINTSTGAAMRRTIGAGRDDSKGVSDHCLCKFDTILSFPKALLSSGQLWLKNGVPSPMQLRVNGLSWLLRNKARRQRKQMSAATSDISMAGTVTQS